MEWAFTEHADSKLMESFQATLTSCAKKPEFMSGIPIGSICSGWGVAEMVMEAVNCKLTEKHPSLPKVRLVENHLLSVNNQ